MERSNGKRFAAIFFVCLWTVIVNADTLDSLFRKIETSSKIDYKQVNQLFVAIDAEGITDSLIVLNRSTQAVDVHKLVCYNMGLLYNNTYRHAQAADAFNQTAYYARKSGDERLEAEALSAAAVQYHMLGNFEQAISLCIEALHIDSLLNDTVALSCDLNILSGSCLSAGHTNDAVHYIRKAIEWESLLSNPTKLAIRYGSAAEIMNKFGDTDVALQYATKAYELERRDGNAIGMARRLSQMADIYVSCKDYDAAERHYRRAIDTLEVHKEFHSLGIDYRLYGNLLQLQGRHLEALSYYERAKAIASQTGNRFFLALTTRSMAESQMALGHNADAAKNLQQALLLNDSLHSERVEQLTADFRTQFDLQEAHTNAQRQEALVCQQRWVIFILALLLLLAVAGLLKPYWLPLLFVRKNGLSGDTVKEDETLKKTDADKPLSLADRQFLVMVSELVHANMKSRKITIDMLAEELCMSRNQFSRRLSAISGETPNSYVTRIKMEKAVRLLRDTTMPVKEVAYECGFDESNYFIHVFRQTYGTTPQQFRQTPLL